MAYNFTVLVVGAGSSGKTCFIQRYLKNAFEKSEKTLILSNESKSLFVMEKQIDLTIVDTPSAKHSVITASQYREADGIIYLFDINNPSSFENVKTLLDSLQNERTKPSCSMLLVANKCDLEAKVERVDMQHLVDGRYDANTDLDNTFVRKFVGVKETSAKTGVNVTSAFEMLIRDMITRQTTQPAKPETGTVNLNTPQTKKGCNC